MGKFDKPAEDKTYETDTFPPSPQIELEKVLVAHQLKVRKWPYAMPLSPSAGGMWWLKMQEPMRDNENPRKELRQNGTQVWVTPYIERLSATLEKYLKLKEKDQEVVFGCWGDGVFWRGDDLDIFYRNKVNIYEETLKFKQDPTAYKSKSRKKLEDLT